MKRERFLRLFRKLLKETPHLPDVAEYLPVKGLQQLLKTVSKVKNCICLTYLGYSLEILDLLIKQLFSLIRIEEDIDLIRDIFGIEVLWGKRYN